MERINNTPLPYVYVAHLRLLLLGSAPHLSRARSLSISPSFVKILLAARSTFVCANKNKHGISRRKTKAQAFFAFSHRDDRRAGMDGDRRVGNHDLGLDGY